MVGRFYYRLRDVEAIKKMTFREMLYWDEWEDAIETEQKRQSENVKK